MTRLSLCMIAKNEELVLRRCLESVRGLVDEIILVDTGSEDETARIASSFGAVVIDHPWENDFAKARNISIAHATGDWILVLDADETVARSDHQAIRSLIESSGPEAPTLYRLIQTTYSDTSATFGWIPNNLSAPEASGYPGYIESPLTRLFLRNHRIWFHGKIHEHAYDDDRSLEPVDLPLRIHHYGKYSHDGQYLPAELISRKDDLYLRLGVQKCEENPQDAQAVYELGAQYWAMGRLEEGKTFLRRAEALAPQWTHPLIALASIATQEGNTEEAMRRFARVLELEPANLLPYLYLPTLLIDVQNFTLAEEILKAGNRYAAHHPTFHINSGVVQQTIGNYRASIDCFHRALKLNEKEPVSLLNLGVSHMELGEWETAEHFLKQAEAFDATRLWAMKKRVDWFFRQNRMEEALEILERARGLYPKDIEIPYQMSVILIRLKRLEDARGLLSTLTGFDKDKLDSVSRERLRQCYAAAGYREQAAI